MSTREQLNSYIEQVEKRLRVGAVLRGAAILTSAALLATFVLVLIINAFAFSSLSLSGARALLLCALICAASLGLVLPLLRLNRRSAAGAAERFFPRFDQRLVTFAERDSREPFIELLAADTLEIARGAQPSLLVPDAKYMVAAGVGVASLAVLIWMIVAGPGYLGYGSSLLWTGAHPGASPLYDLHVSPGDASVRRNSDEMVTAQPIGIQTDKVRLYARYQSASKWEQVTMQPQPGASGFQFLFAGLPEGVEYYVEAGALRSRHYTIRVVDLPSVKQIKVTYRYPQWTGLQNVVEERGGDLRAVEGTQADLEILTDRPLRDGLLVLDDGQEIRLSGGEGNLYKGVVQMDKDGAYHVAALDQGLPVRLSEDFFIEASKANPPEVAINRPSNDYRASPIEEVTVAVKANGDFGLNDVQLHYSVNGGADQAVDMLKQKGQKTADGSTLISLENFKLVPGDLISLYATAKDARSESHTDMFFVQVDPFERDFSQSQQSGGGGGGGGGGQGNQNDISQREKEILSATWKQQGTKNPAAQQAAETAKFLSGVQSTLSDQALSLAGRLQSRELSEENEEFGSFEQDMNAAAQAMKPAAQKLQQEKWSDAIPSEQKALQYLLRAEATFRQIQVAFGGRGGGGGGGGSAGRDLASLFDLELDTEKNQYETAQTAGSSADQRAKDIDDALKKLDELARRQEELAQQHSTNAQDFQQRWQQEMLRREAEELQRQMEQMAQGQGQQGSSSSASSSQSGSQSGSATGQSSSGQSQGNSQGNQGASDPRVQQALNQLRQANDDMRRAASQQQGDADARRAADRLREATNLLGSTQQQQVSGRLDSMAREADRLTNEQREQADRMRQMIGQQTPGNYGGQSASSLEDQRKLAKDRQQLADDVSRIEKNLRDASRELDTTQRAASSKLRDALSQMDESDLQTRLQRSADRLQRGIDPTANSGEEQITAGLQHLSDQVREAQQALGGDQQPGSDALNHVERLRAQMETLSRDFGGPTNSDRQPGQAGQQGQAGRGAHQGGQPGGNTGGGVDGGYRDGYQGGYGGDRRYGYYAGDTGGNSNLPQPAAPDTTPTPGDPERTYQQGMTELNQLRTAVQADPEAAREVQELIREMQQLDPSRFPGNPALVEQLHTQVLSDVDKLELQLRRETSGDQTGQIRSSDPLPVPSGYQDAVAEYFRRLSKTQ